MGNICESTLPEGVYTINTFWDVARMEYQNEFKMMNDNALILLKNDSDKLRGAIIHYNYGGQTIPIFSPSFLLFKGKNKFNASKVNNLDPFGKTEKIFSALLGNGSDILRVLLDLHDSKAKNIMKEMIVRVLVYRANNGCAKSYSKLMIFPHTIFGSNFLQIETLNNSDSELDNDNSDSDNNADNDSDIFIEKISEIQKDIGYNNDIDVFAWKINDKIKKSFQEYFYGYLLEKYPDVIKNMMDVLR
jgi:hypothetical protein